jgi:hypothetical protein
VCSNYYLIYYSLDQSPLWIDHVGYCKGPNPLLWIGHNVIVIGRKRSRPQKILKKPRNIIKVVITTQKKKSALPMKRHFHTCQTCINKEASASLRHTLTCSLRDKFRSCSWRRERERGASLGEDFLYLFELSLGIVLAIYIKEVLLGFLPHEGFPG